MIATQTFLVKMTAGTVESTRVWNSKKPMTIGHSTRWTLTQADGGVSVTPVADDGKKSAEHFLKDKDLAVTATIMLAGLKVEIRPVATLSAAYLTESSKGNSLRIFHSRGSWTIDSSVLGESFTGTNEAKKVFKVKGHASEMYTPDTLIEISVLAEGATLSDSGAKAAVTLVKGEKRRIRFDEISGLKLSHSGSEWRFAAFTQESNPALLTAPAGADSEMTLIKRTLGGALAASLLMGLIAWIMPAPEPVAKVEKVRIFLAKKKTVSGVMTAAPTGDPRAKDFSVGKSGSAKNAGKKGALAKSTKVAPAGKPKAVAQAKPKAAPKSVAKASAPKAAAKSAPTKMAKASAKPTARKNVTTVAARPAPVPRSELFKTFSSAAFQKTAKGLASGGSVSGAALSADSSANAHRLGTAGGSGRGDLGGTGGVETRSASVSGFGGGGGGDGDGGPGSAGAGYGRGSYSKVSGQGRSFVSMDTGASDVDGGLTSDQIDRVVRAHWNEVRYCYEAASLRDSAIQGTVNVRFNVGVNGSVTTAGVGSSTVDNSRVQTCIVGKLKGWKFPRPTGGKAVAVVYPFKFKTTATAAR
jgi:hypothetical protein